MVKDTGCLYLVSQAKEGDRDSLEQLAVQVQHRVYPYLYRFTLDHDVSEDLLQEVLLGVICRIKSLEKIGSFWGWVYRIAQNRVQQHFRDKYKRENLHIRLTKERFGAGPSTLQAVIDKEESQYICCAVNELKKEYREVVRLRFFEALPYSAIASRANCTAGKSRLRFFRAKKRLRQKLCVMGIGG